MNKYLILGGGIAGFSAAKKIRELDNCADITMVSAEKEAPYLRPLLSKTDIRTFQNRIISMAKESWYAENNIKLIKNVSAESINTNEKTVTLSDETKLCYDKCIYALGAECFIPPINGVEKKGVLSLRNTEDFKSLRKLALRSSNAVVIGGGVIGLETAWELKEAGINVTVLESAPRLMSRQLDEESAEYLLKHINNVGVNCFTGVNVSEITGDENVSGVKLSDGRIFEADMVVVSTGIRANSALAKNAGLNVDRDVLVDANMKTSDDSIYAAGDCIQCDIVNPGLWSFAGESGKIAGSNAAGTEAEIKAENYPLIMTAMNTAIFAVGDTSQSSNAVLNISDGKNEIPKFAVNKYDGIKESYDKRFYKDGKLCGAVLIGDISAMYEITEQMEAVK